MGSESEESPQNMHADQSDSLRMPAWVGQFGSRQTNQPPKTHAGSKILTQDIFSSTPHDPQQATANRWGQGHW